jgi:hypothetical protein
LSWLIAQIEMKSLKIKKWFVGLNSIVPCNYRLKRKAKTKLIDNAYGLDCNN